MPGLVFLPCRHGNQGMVPHCQRTTLHLSPRRYVTSPSRIIPSPGTSESFNKVDPSTKGRVKTRREERAGEAIEQPHDDEWLLAHGAYIGGDGAAEMPYRHTGRMYTKQRGAYTELSFSFRAVWFFWSRGQVTKGTRIRIRGMKRGGATRDERQTRQHAGLTSVSGSLNWDGCTWVWPTASEISYSRCQ
jgi:hypothetical protein